MLEKQNSVSLWSTSATGNPGPWGQPCSFCLNKQSLPFTTSTKRRGKIRPSCDAQEEILETGKSLRKEVIKAVPSSGNKGLVFFIQRNRPVSLSSQEDIFQMNGLKGASFHLLTDFYWPSTITVPIEFREPKEMMLFARLNRFHWPQQPSHYWFQSKFRSCFFKPSETTFSLQKKMVYMQCEHSVHMPLLSTPCENLL